MRIGETSGLLGLGSSSGNECSVKWNLGLGRAGPWGDFRLEGPSLTWHFRGHPHVHVWAHVARTPDVPFNSIAIEL